MNIILLVAATLLSTAQSFTKKLYSGKGGIHTFNAITAAAFELFFVIFSVGKMQFDSALIPYSIAFGAAFTMATVFSLLAIINGSLALTSLVLSFSLLIPTVFGLIFLKESVGTVFYVGLALLIVSLVLINYTKEDAKITLKWVILVIIAFIANGMCSVFQKLQQLCFDGAYKSEFMLEAVGVATVVFAALTVIYERKQFIESFRNGWLLASVTGFCCGATNLFVMYLTNMMETAVMFPVISGGGIVLSFLGAILLFREKFTVKQCIGVALGVVSVVLFNI